VPPRHPKRGRESHATVTDSARSVRSPTASALVAAFAKNSTPGPVSEATILTCKHVRTTSRSYIYFFSRFVFEKSFCFTRVRHSRRHPSPPYPACLHTLRSRSGRCTNSSSLAFEIARFLFPLFQMSYNDVLRQIR